MSAPQEGLRSVSLEVFNALTQLSLSEWPRPDMIWHPLIVILRQHKVDTLVFLLCWLDGLAGCSCCSSVCPLCSCYSPSLSAHYPPSSNQQPICKVVCSRQALVGFRTRSDGIKCGDREFGGECRDVQKCSFERYNLNWRKAEQEWLMRTSEKKHAWRQA